MKHSAFNADFGAVVEPTRETGLDQLERESVIDLFKRSGLLLFRGFGARAEVFERFSGSFSGEFMTYMGGGYQRRTINESGDKSIMSVNYYLGTPEQATFALPLHGEIYYLDHRPWIIWFLCVTPAVKDGQTSVCDGARLYRELRPETRALFEHMRLKYIRHYEEADWQKRFQTEDLDVVERFCRDNGMRVEVDRTARTVLTEYFHPAWIRSRWSGQTVFINTMLPVLWQERHGRTTNIVRLEDGSEIPPAVVDEIEQATERLKQLIPWTSGDVAMLDNTRVLHGRQRFDDDQRQIYSRMVRNVDW
jgi:alpha-ketoglutarate-dependent taurine dioxygenase